MLKVTKKLSHSHDLAVNDAVVLSYDQRKKGRLKCVTEKGADIGLFLERGQTLQQGDLLKTECGQIISVKAANEDVVTAKTNSWHNFSKVCYHLGNRHLPLEIGDCWCRFQPDHVLEDLAKLYGLNVEHESAPFNPESGAYGDHASGHHHHD